MQSITFEDLLRAAVGWSGKRCSGLALVTVDEEAAAALHGECQLK